MSVAYTSNQYRSSGFHFLMLDLLLFSEKNLGRHNHFPDLENEIG